MGTLRVRVSNSGNNLVDSRVTLRQQDTRTGCTVNSLTAFVNNTGADGEHTFVLPFGHVPDLHEQRERHAPAPRVHRPRRHGHADRPARRPRRPARPP